MTPKQQRFVDEYLVDLNATQAAIRAGYATSGARTEGARLLANADIQDAIALRQSQIAVKLNVTQERIVAEYAKIAFQDIRNVVRWGSHPLDAESLNADPNGLNIYPVSLIPSDEISPDVAAAVAEVSLTQSGVRVKMHDKKGALDSLAKHLGMFIERHEHTVTGMSDAERADRLVAIFESARKGGTRPAPGELAN